MTDMNVEQAVTEIGNTEEMPGLHMAWRGPRLGFSVARSGRWFPPVVPACGSCPWFPGPWRLARPVAFGWGSRFLAFWSFRPGFVWLWGGRGWWSVVSRVVGGFVVGRGGDVG